MKQFITYTRVSTREQGKSGLGLEAQERDIELYLDNYVAEPYEVLETFRDIESGKRDDRPELDKAISLAKETGATLLVAKLDRLSRHAREAITLAGLPNALRIADLRRTGTTEMVEAGVTMGQIMAVTGHASPNSVKPYMKNTYTSAESALTARKNHVKST